MITMPPYIYDYEAFDLLDPADRWIYDKVDLSTQLGYYCGAHGTQPDVPGDYVVRPVTSLHGMGTGGFFKVTLDDWLEEPGYFWCEWFIGPHHWTQYINDVAVSHAIGILNNSGILECAQLPVAQAPDLPAPLQNFSRYMLAERIGDNVIECVPRFMTGNAQRRFVADYKQIDPMYTLKNDERVRYGTTDMKRAPITLNGHDGYTWGDSDIVDYNRRVHNPAFE